jgi:hypothetical protein
MGHDTMAAVIELRARTLRRRADRLEQLAETTPDRVEPSCRDWSGEQNTLRERAAVAGQRANVAELGLRRVPRWR